MATNNSIFFFLVFFLFNLNKLKAQSNYETGFLSTFSATNNFKQNIDLSISTETRTVLSEGNFKQKKENGFKVELHQFALNLSKKIKKHQLGTTFTLRFRDNTTHYRSSFLYTHTSTFNKVKFSNRLATDQTFTNKDSPIFRFRYRVGVTIPIKNQKANNKMFYAKITNEYLSILEASLYDLEIRLTPTLGYQINKKAKIELGLESRIGKLIQDKKAFSTDFWINTGLSIKL